MLNHTELKDRESEKSKVPPHLGVNLAFLLVDQFGFKDSFFDYLNFILDSDTVKRYKAVDYRNASDIKNLVEDKPYFYIKCGLFAFVLVRLKDLNTKVANHYLEPIKFQVSVLIEDEKNQVRTYEKRASDHLEAEKKQTHKCLEAEKKQTHKCLEADKRSSLVSV